MLACCHAGALAVRAAAKEYGQQRSRRLLDGDDQCGQLHSGGEHAKCGGLCQVQDMSFPHQPDSTRNMNVQMPVAQDNVLLMICREKALRMCCLSLEPSLHDTHRACAVQRLQRVGVKLDRQLGPHDAPV